MHLHNNTTQQYPDIPVHKQTQYPDTICTHTNKHIHLQRIQIQNTNTDNNNMQHIQNSTENTEYNTEQHTEDNAQPQHSCSTYDLHKYSFDLYHEQIYINNSNTIELYTILQENI